MNAAPDVPPPAQPTPPRDENDRKLDPSPPPTTDAKPDSAGTEAERKPGTSPDVQPVPERQDR